MIESNPIRILKTLDSFLKDRIELVVYGKAALHLLFQNDSSLGITNDVDLIVPEVHISMFDQRLDFWEAMEGTNEKLKSEGLYLTHVFEEKQIILHPDWFHSKISIDSVSLDQISLYVPSPVDLILTKMMRVDPIDREDIRFIFEQAKISSNDLRDHLKRAVCPHVEEIKEAFEQNKRWLESEDMT